MTKLTESAIYSPTIFRLETTTPVAGGEVILDGNGDPVQGHANAQAQLLANRTKYLKGVTDTLGTAAVANLTTSATDTTAGRVLKAGDAGILGFTSQYTDGNLLPNGIGLYAWSADSTGANLPLGVAINWQGVESGGINANRGATTAFAPGADRMAFRTRVTGVNGPWCENWHSRGTNAITVDTGSFGYGTGSGGTVTQATSKATAVTLNKPSGRVTTAADSLAAGAEVSFQLTNSKIAATDIVLVSSVAGPGMAAYEVSSWGVSAGFCYIRIKNISVSAAAHAVSINFVVIKGALA